MNKKIIEPTGIFTRYVSMAIPGIFDESLSYYEALCSLYKMVKDLSEIVNDDSEAIIELQEKFNELKTYVDTYFENLDIQTEINNKLDDMAEHGELTEIIAQYLELAGILAFNTKADMKNAENLADGSYAKTYGTTTYNDGYGYFYKIREVLNTDVIDDDNIIALANYPELIAEKIPDNVLVDYVTEKLTEFTEGKKFFVEGNDTPVAGSKAITNWVIDNNVSSDSAIGGLYPGVAKTFTSIAEKIDSTYSSTGNPYNTLSVINVNDSSNVDGVGLWIEAKANDSGVTAFGSNIIATNELGTSNTKLVGLEIDIEPSSGTTVTDGGGLLLNAFNVETSVPAIQVGTVSNGKFENGIIMNGVKKSCIAAQSGLSCESFINTSAGSYSESAVVIGNNQKIHFNGNSKTGKIFNDNSDNLRIVNANNVIIRNNADTTSLVSIGDSGILNLEANTINFLSGLTSSSANSGGANLPSNPVGFLAIQIGGTVYKLPFYNS